VKRRDFLFLLCFLPLSASAVNETDNTLKIGLFPNLTPFTLIAVHQPIRLYLEQQLHRPVQLLTAPDFRSFARRTQRGEYDLVLTAPHLARLAELDAGYVPVATYDEELQALLLVAKHAPFTRLTELRGTKIAIPDPLAVVNMLGLEMLNKAGVSESEYVLVNAHSHNGAALAVLRGEAQAAILGSVPFAQLASEVRNELRVLASSRPIQSQYWLVNGRVDANQRRQIQNALLQFSATPEGRKYMASRGCRGVRKTAPDELRSEDAFAREVRKLLDAGS
jgi:phosphonate transport system substrate-binding protein